MDIPTCTALPSLELAGKVSQCKMLEMNACFHKLVFNIRLSHPQNLHFQSQNVFFSKILFLFCSVYEE